ncbi:hypothetical protein GQR58_023778 [Nymphon striatum]|nr:hypothetical protein GQR58_023778 [Nymphon striatum]
MKTDLRKVEFYEILFDLVPYLSERACRKIHKQVGEVGFEDAVARALKHAPNKKGGYRFKVIEIIRNSHTTKFAENNGTGRVGLRGLYYKLNLIRLNGENNLICSVLN